LLSGYGVNDGCCTSLLLVVSLVFLLFFLCALLCFSEREDLLSVCLLQSSWFSVCVLCFLLQLRLLLTANKTSRNCNLG